MPPQRSGDANDDRVRLPQTRQVARGGESLARGERAGHLLSQVFEIVVPVREGLDLRRIDVESEDAEAAPVQRVRQRETDVPQADDADQGVAALDAALQGFMRAHRSSRGTG